jgi:hypothetical protein
MVNIVIVEKKGTSITKKVPKLTLENLYKKCNFRKSEDFIKIHSFKVKTYYVHIFGKSNGKANQENKFEFPPPIDNELFFGNMAIVKTNNSDINNENIVDYTYEEWNTDYEFLMGGFEDIGSNSDDDYESDELKNIPKEQLTKEGYLKDDFVVDDDKENSNHESESEEEYSDSELSEEEYESETDTD